MTILDQLTFKCSVHKKLIGILLMFFVIIAIQVQERSRGCNVAQHGGSTEICTETQTESRSCGEDCGELNHVSGLTLIPMYNSAP